MNGWDLFTWISAIVLAVSGVLIFGFFVRDARHVMQERGDDSEP